MSSQKNAAPPFISIGEEKNEVGEPVFSVAGVGVIGTVAEVKSMIDRYEVHAGLSSYDAAGDDYENWAYA